MRLRSSASRVLGCQGKVKSTFWGEGGFRYFLVQLFSVVVVWQMGVAEQGRDTPQSTYMRNRAWAATPVKWSKVEQ